MIVRKWIIKILGPLWLIFLLDLVLYFGLNSSIGPRILMKMAIGSEMAGAYKTDAVRFSPFLQHFCAKNLECSGPDGLALRARSLCGKINMLGIMAFHGGLCMDSLKADGLRVNLDKPQAVSRCFGSLGKENGSQGGLKTQVDSLMISNGAISLDFRGGTALLSHLMVTGGFSTVPLVLQGQVAGKYTLTGQPEMEKLFGHTGKFMIDQLAYKGTRLSMNNFSIGNRMIGRFSGILPLGKGPMNLSIFQAYIPELAANGARFTDLQFREGHSSISGVKGEMDLDYFAAEQVEIPGTSFLLSDLWGAMTLSATLITGLDLDQLTLMSKQLNAVLSGSSESVIDASVLKLNVVAWNARGEFLIRNKLYPQAEAGHLYSGVGTILVKIHPFKLESARIHWVTQWSSIF